MPVTPPSNPPATTVPAAAKTWMQAVVDMLNDHETRVVATEGGNTAGSNLYLHANYR